MVKYKQLFIPKHKDFRIIRKFKLFYTEQVEDVKIIVWFDFIYELHQYTDLSTNNFLIAKNRKGINMTYIDKKYWEKVCICSDSITKNNYKEVTKMLNASEEDRNLAFGLIKNNLPVTITYIIDNKELNPIFRELRYAEF